MIFDYGSLVIFDRSGSRFVFKFVSNPTRIAFYLSETVKRINPNTLNQKEYELKNDDDAKKALQKKYDEKGKCPRCSSTKLQAVTSHAVLKGSGWSNTQRMCMNCSKKFN